MHGVGDRLCIRLRTKEVAFPTVIALFAGELREAVDRAAQRGARITGGWWNEHSLERRLAEQPIVGRTVQSGAACEAEIVQASVPMQPVCHLEQRFLESTLTGGREVRDIGKPGSVAALIAESRTLTEDLAPARGNRHHHAVDFEWRKAERGGIAMRSEAHDLALIAFARKHRLG